MKDTKYVAMDVHTATISVAVLNFDGKLIMESVIEAKRSTIVEFIQGWRGELFLTFEEGTWSAWLYDRLTPYVTKIVVCDPPRNALLKQGSAHDRIDARKLANRLRLHSLRAALLVAIVQPPHRFRTQRRLWKSSGLGVVTQTSADHQDVDGQLQRSKKPAFVRGLDPAHPHHLKSVFQSAAIQASTTKGPFQDFYQALVAKGMRPEMARLTLARKMATMSWMIWRKGVAFDAKYLKAQTA